MSRTTASILVLSLLSACSGGDGGSAGVVALFEVPRGEASPSGFYALPFPNDIRTDDDGTIAVTDHPRPNDIVASYIDVMETRLDGFGLHPVVFFRFSDTIDDATLPVDAAASREELSSVYLVNVDTDSPNRGTRIPVRCRFDQFDGSVIGTDWLGLQTYPGFVLEEGTTYAAVVTTRVRALAGAGIERDDDFSSIMADDVAGDTHLERAAQLYEPLLLWLDEAGGDEREDVLSATVFTTQSGTDVLARVRTVIHRDIAAPVPRDIVLDSEAATHVVYTGLFDAPNFQSGAVPYRDLADGGEILLDINGDPIPQVTEALRFALSVPVGPTPTDGWPVVLYAHGTGGSYKGFTSSVAGRLAAEGLAVLSMDQVLHGPRNPAGTAPEVAFFNIANPLAARDNNLQGAIDLFNLTRLAVAFNHEDVDNSRLIDFDENNIGFFGHSQGGITGTPFLAVEPLVSGAVLSGSGGLLYLSLLLKTEPLDIPSLIGAFIRDQPIDEFNQVLALLQMYLDRADTVSYARRVILDPLPGNAPKHIFQSEGIVDNYTPLPSIEALAVSLGLEQVGPVLQPVPGLDLKGSPLLTAPVTGNVGGATAVFLQYSAAEGRDGHFVLFDVAEGQYQSSRFLGTLLNDGAATLVGF